MRCPACPGCPALCLSCFSRGAEFPGHRNDHPYAVIGRCCPVGEGWGGAEELALLGAVGDCGLGDWAGVSARVRGRGAGECRGHYTRCYVEQPPPPLAGLLGQQDGASAEQEADPVEYVGGMEHPPRPAPGTAAAVEVAGYNAARGDFETEWDSGAEAWVSSLDPGLFDGAEEDCPGAALVAALLDGYRRRLAGRHETKRVMRNLGLVTPGWVPPTLARLRHDLPRPLWDALPRLAALLDPEELAGLAAGWQLARELRRQVDQLREWRRAGLRRPGAAATYQALLQRRLAARRARQALPLPTGLAPVPAAPGEARRRQRLPLYIRAMPGYDSLAEAEAALASELRLSPEAFLHHKRLLVAESARGGLRLAQARTLLKIDVNKTRRIFDLLAAQGDIHPAHGPAPPRPRRPRTQPPPHTT